MWLDFPFHAPAVTNQARREREDTERYPTADDLVFASRAELAVYEVLCELQRERKTTDTLAMPAYEARTSPFSGMAELS